MKKILLFILIVELFSCCCSEGTYHLTYSLENKLEGNVVNIKLSDSLEFFRYKADKEYIVNPQEKKIIYHALDASSDGEVEDVLELYNRNHLGQFDVYVDSVKIDKPLWNREYWTFSIKGNVGNYLLTIDEEILK